MRNNYSNFNHLSVFGKVVDKPDFFEGLMSFKVFQEGTNLFMNVLCEEDESIKLGYTLDVRGKLMFDVDEQELILHATEIFVVSNGSKVKETLTTIFQKKQSANIELNNREEDTPAVVEIQNHSEQTSIAETVVTSQPTNVLNEPPAIEKNTDSNATGTGFKLFKVSKPEETEQLPPANQQNAAPAPMQQPAPQYVQQNAPQAPVQQPVSQNVPHNATQMAQQNFVEPQFVANTAPQQVPPTNVGNGTPNIQGQQIQQPPVQQEQSVVTVAPRVPSTPAVTEKVEETNNTGYSLSDFDC